MRHALVAVLLAFVPCLAQAQKTPAPNETSLASIQLPRFTPPTYDTVVPELFHVELEGGALRTVTYIEPHADGMVKMTVLDGGFDYVPTYRIRRILDQDGRE